MSNILKKYKISPLIKPRPHFSFDFPATVWRVKTDAVLGHLAIECRDADLFLASFWVVEASSGKVLLEGLQPREPWWVGMEALQNHTLLLHGYADRKSGLHRGIEAFAVPEGELRWQQPLLQFHGIRQGKVFAWDHPSSNLPTAVSVDLQDGTVTTEPLPLEQLVAEASVPDQTHELPTQYPEGSAFFTLIRDFLAQYHPDHPSALNAVDYLETPGQLFIGFYVALNQGKLRHRLAQFDLEGRYQWDVVLNHSVEGVGGEAFFLFKGNLFLIQDGKSIHSFVI